MKNVIKDVKCKYKWRDREKFCERISKELYFDSRISCNFHDSCGYKHE